MAIEYITPLSRAWQRMLSVLFRPFDLGLWLTLGFTAFLSELLNSYGGFDNKIKQDRVGDLEEVLRLPLEARDWLLEHPTWSMLIVIAVLMALALIILLLWLSSRGKFMFLDNVVQRRALIRQPWQEFRELAWSLWQWRLAIGLAIVALVGMLLYQAWQELYHHYAVDMSVWTVLAIVLKTIVLLASLALIAAYVLLLQDHFIIPIMYKHRCPAGEAWRRFLTLHWDHLGSFILYGLFVLLLQVVVLAVVVFVGLMTCCLGFILLLIPYIGSVILLPITYAFRALSVEFLAQFGAEFAIELVELPRPPGQVAHP